MQTNLVCNCIISFFILFNTVIPHLRFIYAQTTSEPYQNCSATFDCGNITEIGYPFWGSNRPEYCGHPKFELNCTDETAKIKIEELTYRVLDINSESKNLKVVREDHIGDLCPEPRVNTTLDWQVLSYASGIRNITLYYGCPENSSTTTTRVTTGIISYSGNDSGSSTIPTSQITSFLCNDSKGFFTTQDLNNSTLINYVGSCTTKVLVPATQSDIQPLTQDGLLVALDQGFGLQWDVNNSICETCSNTSGVCGYNSTTASFACYCSDGQQQPFSCGGTTTPNQRPQSGGWHAIGVNDPGILTPAITINDPGIENSRKRGDKLLRIKVSIGVSSAFTAIIIASLGFYYCFKRKKGISRGNEEDNVEAFIMNYHSLMPQRYSYSDIKKMTNSFTHKLGQGGFGGVYRGNLSDGRLVAVKLLHKLIGDGEEFINEVASISRTSHVNVVNLFGFCYQRTKRALVYEYMPNGSLDKFICHGGSHQDKTCHLEQKTLFEIAIGIARGLEYLHRGCNTRIVHFDIKPHNILLDKDMCPKISDFGLAKLCKGKESIVSILGARGTAGYIAPEVFMRGYGGVSYKSDVYSYGMMILEMFAGKHIVHSEGTQNSSDTYFPDFIYKYLDRVEMDENMKGEEEEQQTVRRRMIIVGLWCIQTNPTDRPSMTKVIEMLEGSIEFLQIPPKPRLFSSTKPAEFSSSSIHLQSQLDEDKTSSLHEAELASN